MIFRSKNASQSDITPNPQPQPQAQPPPPQDPKILDQHFPKWRMMWKAFDSHDHFLLKITKYVKNTLFS